jgi:hypothetical protein
MLEKRVWGEVSSLLSNPNKLQALAKEWLQITGVEDDSSANERQRLELQETKLLRAISLVQDDYYLADEAEHEQMLGRIEKYRSDLSAVTSRKSLLDAYRADANLQTRQLESLADLAQRAKHRLSQLDLSEQREVFELLGVRVVISRVVDSEPTRPGV